MTSWNQLVSKVGSALLSGLLGVGTVSAQQAPKKYAFLVGINDYVAANRLGVPNLKYAVKDVEDLSDALERQGYQVRKLLDADAKRRSIVLHFYWYATHLGPEDTFLLFFAGHGLRNEAINKATYWLTNEALPDLLDLDGIRLNHLMDFVGDLPAKLKIVILDHCFSGNVIDNVIASSSSRDATSSGARVDRNAKIETGEFERGVAIPKADVDRQKEAAGGEGTVVLASALSAAYETDEYEQGIFTSVLLKALTSPEADTGGDGRLSVLELVSYVKPRVETLAADSGLNQTVATHLGVKHGSQAIIAPNLAASSVEDLKERVKRYTDIIELWYMENNLYGLTFVVRMACKKAIRNFERAEGDINKLTKRDRDVWNKLVDHLEALDDEEDGQKVYVPEVLSQDLEQAVRRLLPSSGNS